MWTCTGRMGGEWGMEDDGSEGEIGSVKVLVNRLEARSRVENECKVWTKGTDKNGYGIIRLNGKNIKVHRLAYELLVGPIPDGLHVHHHCDNPPCFEKTHLWLGTQADNVRDMIEKGREAKAHGDKNSSRLYPGIRRGERNGRAMPTEEQVQEIRVRYACGKITQQQLAREYGMSQVGICQVILRRNWRHVK